MTVSVLISAFGPLIIGILGVWLTFVWASAAKKKTTRRFVLFVAPATTVAAIFLLLLFVSKVLPPAEGSGVLLGGAVFGFSLVGLAVYYPILIIIWIVRRFKQRKK